MPYVTDYKTHLESLSDAQVTTEYLMTKTTGKSYRHALALREMRHRPITPPKG